jgi:predicted HAD superfamily phosphohydrolase YqeG
MNVIPTANVTSLRDLNLEVRPFVDVELLLLDYDGTLHNGSTQLLSTDNCIPIRNWIASSRIHGFVVVSNAITKTSAGRRKKADTIEARLERIGLTPQGVYCFGLAERKPKPDGIKRVLQIHGYATHQVALIGDQPVSDIAVANTLGIPSVLVQPVGPYGWSTHLSLRSVRNWIARRKIEVTTRSI